nr:tRNA (5-methylaminomethyl-2-thiouridine)(34)-methyltransferase MnmD [Allomuricauda sp.]
MKRKIITTADGSKTIHLEAWNEQYHSKHGAIQEAYHVFITHGLHLLNGPAIKILEIGFGTGLNALITLLESEKANQNITYVGVEAYPVLVEEVKQLDYCEQLNAVKYQTVFEHMHDSLWERPVSITESFQLHKQQKDFREIHDKEEYNLVYFDAFGARVQPELWSEEVFQAMYHALKQDGVLVTYAAKGSVRRAMQAVGFTVERLPGPPGKREMLRATKK